MGAKIKGAEYPLAKIFSSDFDYYIPSYQRPYAWSEDETVTLYNDLYDFYNDESKDENYFLGSIVLIKEEDKPHSDVIDGQQRLTTLTILLAALTSKLSGADRSDFESYIIEPGRASQGLSSRPRLNIRERDNDFFMKYIQSMNFEELLKLDGDSQATEAQGNIVKNARCLMKKIEQDLDSTDKIIQFGAFLVQRCFLVAVSTPTPQSAFRIFSVMNSRGMSLLMTDIIKADLIGALPNEKQKKYTDKWEEMEIELGRNEFNDLFGQIRMIKLKTKPKKSVQEEYYTYILTDIDAAFAVDFIDNVLEPYSDAYAVITNSLYEASSGADSVNNILQWLNRIDNTDWLPSAMAFYVKHKNNAAELEKYFAKLERLAACMRTLSWDVNQRIERYANVLADIENTESGFGDSIELTEDEKKYFISELQGDIYRMTSKKRNYLILRLDSFIADTAAKYDSKVLTIEHVLPQTVNPNSEWASVWPDEEQREKWVHKIGNLLPLTKRHNSEAQNYDFDVKKEKYFRGKSGTTTYALTSQVLSYAEWTPDIVEKRQNEMIEAFKKAWEL